MPRGREVGELGVVGHHAGAVGLQVAANDRVAARIIDEQLDRWIYVGDSANDEPMFAHFPLSVGVANVREQLELMAAWPRFVSQGEGGHGFAEFAQRLLQLRAG